MYRWMMTLGVLVTVLVQPVDAALLPAAPPPGFTLQSIDAAVSDAIKLKINTYTAAKTSYAWDVYCPGDFSKKVGALDFEYAPYTGDFDGGALNTFGGAIIRGGFKKSAEMCEPLPGASYRWLQHIVVSGDQTASTIDGDPLYPDFTLTGYDALLFDAPGRGTLGTTIKNLSWLAESALVCVVGKDVYALGSFLWGFEIKTEGTTTSVNAQVPQLWSTGITPSFSTKFNEEFGKDGSREKGWTLQEGCCCIPEPAALLMLLAGVLPLMRRPRGRIRVRLAA